MPTAPESALPSAFCDAITQALGNKVSFALGAREQAAQEVTHHKPHLPDAVVFAHEQDDVQILAELCNQHHVPIVARAQGSSLEGHIAALKGGVSLDMNAMNAILEVNAGDLDCRVQAGVTRKQLNEHLRDTGLFFPIDPGADASIGGMTATRASGTNAVRYGTMRENVLGLSAIMADGSLMRCGTRARKSAAGYDLTRLLVGSEGTLGLITEVQLRLYGIPEAMSAAICAFETIEGAVEAVQLIMQMGIPVARVEFLDAMQIKAVNAYSKTNYAEEPHLFFEFHGTSASVEEQAAMVGEICSDFGGKGFQWATDAETRNKLWQARHDAYWASLALRPGCKGLATDICVPISRLSESLLSTRKMVADLGLVATMAGHVGDGNYHLLLMLDENTPEDWTAAAKLNEAMVGKAIELGGTCTGEHGVGYGKKKYLPKEMPTALPVMASIKRALDPNNILNPGKIFDLD
jgi:D-lactate dehydrogenase (cytochrome)